MKITAPMLSLAASGSFAGTIVAATNKGRPYMRLLVTPSNPKSPGQTATRAMMAFLGKNWANLTANEKATWLTLAEQTNISQFNAYQQFNMKRWTQFQSPIVTPTQAAGTVPVMGALTVTPGVRQVTISQVITTLNDIWGMIIVRSLTTGFTPAKTDVVAVQYGIASPIVRIDTPVAAGTYFYRTAGFNRGGTTSAYVAQQQAIVA